MQFSLQMCSLVVMALASASAALPGAPANSNTNWEFKGYAQTGNQGKEFSLTGSGSGCHDFDQDVNSYNWNSGKFYSGKKESGCSFTLYKGKKCTDGDLYNEPHNGPYNGPSDSKKGDLSNDQHKAASIKIECPV